jgi:chemotaxis signal transduction protein
MVELVRLSIGGTGFALPLAAVAAVLEPPAMIASEAAAHGPWVGQIPSRLGSIPVASGHDLFGGRADSAVAGKIVVIRRSIPFALHVDEVLGSASVDNGAIFALPPTCGATDRLLTRAAGWMSDDQIDLLIDEWALEAELMGGWSVDLDQTREPAARHDLAAGGMDDAGDDWNRWVEVELSSATPPLALPANYVRHIADHRVPASLPRANRAVLGLLAWQRHPIPLVDLARVLGLGRTSSPGMAIVVGPPMSPEAAAPPFVALSVSRVRGLILTTASASGNLLTSDGRTLPTIDLPRLVDELARGATPP